MFQSHLWSVQFLGSDIFHIAASFVIYSMLGWLVESIYMSFCEKRITNRGFAKGPFCPIYGFGATFGCLFIAPLAHSYFLVYVVGAIGATAFEYIAALIMIKFLGSLWWDYNNKPYNYKGILCLESTVGWGFYAIGCVEFLNPWLLKKIDSVNQNYMIVFIVAVLGIAVVDYIIQILKVVRKSPDKVESGNAC